MPGLIAGISFSQTEHPNPGYTQIKSSPSVFRNQDGSIRFTLVVDDFAVVWTDRTSIDHFIKTLTLLYQVKVNWHGTKYLGMDISINRSIKKLPLRVCPNGLKGASTPARYVPPNYAKPGAQKATIDASPWHLSRTRNCFRAL
jgi:hypothetical protein